jgi:hypothetical protein
MASLFNTVAASAGRHHGAISTAELASLGVSPSLRAKWVRRELLIPIGPRSYVVAGAPRGAAQVAWCAAADVSGLGYVAGRTAAWLHGLDGFQPPPRPEVLLRREHRGARLPYVVRTTSRPFGGNDAVTVKGVRCLSAERLVLESPRFDFTASELENAIDSGIRRKKLYEPHLRERVLAAVRPGSGRAAVREALLDSGGESRLERWFLAIVRTGGLPRPEMRVVVRAGGEFAARLDASFPGGLVIELEGHATHSSRQQRQHDEERRTVLTLAGYRVIVFTYNDVRDRPDWVLGRLRSAIGSVA